MIVHAGHTNCVNSVAFSPDGKSVISGSSDKTVRTWDAHGSSSIGEPLEGHTWEVDSVQYSPLGNLIASASKDTTIRLWDPSTGKQSGAALEGTNCIESVAFSPDAKLVTSNCGPSFASTSDDVQLWDLQTRKAASGPFKGHTDNVNSVSFSPDGTRLVSGSNDKTILVWDVERGTSILGPINGHTGGVLSAAFSPNNAQIVSCSSDGTIRLWDSRTGRIVSNSYIGDTYRVNSVCFSPRGTYIASGGSDKAVLLWDVRVGRQVGQPFQEHTYEVTSVAFSPCGQYIASGSRDRRVIIRKVLGEDQYAAANDDDEPQIVSSQMSIQQIFDCLCRAGCIDLSSQMDTRQETAMIASGGGFGDIWMGELYSGGKVAIKAWRTTAFGRTEYKTLKRAARELYLWSRMNHPHIHRLQGVILFREQYLGMVSEWMENGNLHDYLLKNPGADRYQLCVHVASGVEYMHGRNTIHGDLKALNILVSSDGIARISDFDFSIMSGVSSLVFTATSNNRAGSIRWVAPEMFDDTPKRTTQTDVYAFGMTMLEIFTGDVPYPDRREDYAVMTVVTRGVLPNRPAQYLRDDEQGNRIWKLMLDCWNRTPSDRPSAGQVLKVLESAASWG